MALFAALLAVEGAFACAIGLVLVARAPAHRAIRLFGFYLLVDGLAEVAVWTPRGLDAVGGVLDPARIAQGAAAATTFQLAVPFLLAAFALLYPAPRLSGSRGRLAVAGLLGGAVVAAAAYALDHTLIAGPPGVLGPLYYVKATAPFLEVGVSVLFVADVLRRRAPAHDAALLVLAVLIPLSTTYTAARELLYFVAGRSALPPLEVLWALALLPVGVAAALLLRRGRRGSPEAKARMRRAAAGLLAGPASALLVTLLVVGVPGLEPAIAGLPAASIALAAPLLMAYALLRHRLFDVDLQVKRRIPGGLVAGSFLGVFVLGTEASRGLLGGNAPYAGAAGAAFLLLALPQLRRAGGRVAERAMPGVADDTTYLNLRRIEVYRAALEEAHAGRDGPSDATRARLAALRAELGLTERDHALLEYALLSGTPQPRPLEPGSLALGRYRVTRRLGQGGNGTTYLAHDEERGNAPVALKVLRPERGGDPEVVREARAMQAVTHPHVVRMHDVLDLAGQVVLVMEYVEGGSLQDRLAAGPLDPEGFARVARGLLAALGAVHASHAVHRDVKPSNVLLTASGEAKLADFGVAYVPGMETTMGGDRDLAGAIGTIRFMSPEQARGRRADARSDLYSAAATLFEAHTGKPYLAPLPGESSVELQLRAAAGVPFPRGFEGPGALGAWFRKALDPRPEKRFPSAQAMGEALDRALAEARPRRARA